jgi:ADP-heptose:LPS heptosyltransferase
VLRERGCRVVVTGSEGERELCREVAVGAEDLSGRLSLAELAALVGSASLLLSADTGVAHLATAYGTRSITLFGPTPPALWGPAIDPELHTVVYKAPPGYRGDPHASTADEALLAITAADVISLFHE